MAGRYGDRRTNRRDPLALAVNVATLLVVVGTWVWWGRGIDSDVTSLKEWRVEEIRLKREEAKEKVNLDAMQTLQIVALQKDVTYMREMLEKIDKKIPERAR